MQEAFENLVSLLENEVKVYQTLLDLLVKEKSILIGAKIPELEESNQSKDTILARLREIESERSQLAYALARYVGAQTERPRLLEISEKLGGADGQRLKDAHTALKILVERCKEQNLLNEAMVRSALDHVQGYMNSVRESLDDKTTYKPKGAQKKANVQAGQLVSREA